MKKITLTIAAIAAVFTMNAQETISFESSEGYELGNINEQNGWVVAGDGEGGFISGQEITDEMASDGDYSFKITEVAEFGPQQNYIMGGFYGISLDYTDTSISFDIYTDNDGVAEPSDFVFMAIGSTNLVTAINFNFEGNVAVTDTDAFENASSFSYGEWYNVEINLTDSGISFMIDGEEVYSNATAITAEDIAEIRFVHDNYGGFAYIDNIEIDEANMSVENTENVMFDHYVQEDNLFMTASTSIENVQLFNILGQQVLNESLSSNDAQINISGLNSGVHLAKVQVEGKTKTFKFVK